MRRELQHQAFDGEWREAVGPAELSVEVEGQPG
jgi:hypothetical protein